MATGETLSFQDAINRLFVIAIIVFIIALCSAYLNSPEAINRRRRKRLERQKEEEYTMLTAMKQPNQNKGREN